MPGPYADIELFQRIIETGSIRAAAREARLEPSSVSRRLTKLESRLGTRLFDRSQARSRPTPAGRRYYEQTRTLLAQLQAVDADVAGEAEVPKGLLRVNAPIDFGQRHLAGWLLDFAARHPAVEVELTLSSHFVDLVAEGIDIAVRVGRLRDSSLKATKLADVPRVMVAAPLYLERHGEPKTASDLGRHEHVFFAPGNAAKPLVLIDPDGGKHEVTRQGRITVNAVYSVVEAVKAGFGIHTGPRWAFQASIDAGELVEVLPGYRQPSMPMNAIWSPAVLLPARTRRFVDHLRAAVRQLPGLEPVGLF